MSRVWRSGKVGADSGGIQDRKQMNCTICGKIALRRVGIKGYCKQHLKEAFAAAKKAVYYCIIPPEFGRLSARKSTKIAVALSKGRW